MLRGKREKFCVEYVRSGNATEAYKLAGYKVKNDNSAAAFASKLLRNVKVSARIAELTREMHRPDIADAEERQQFWTSVMRDKGEKMEHRLSASAWLGRAQNDFIQRVDVSTAIPVVIHDDVSE